MTEARYKKGDYIESINGHSGKIFLVYYNDECKTWIYFVDSMVAIKESNIKDENSNNKNSIKRKTKRTV